MLEVVLKSWESTSQIGKRQVLLTIGDLKQYKTNYLGEEENENCCGKHK
jgi:hypothetical protein